MDIKQAVYHGEFKTSGVKVPLRVHGTIEQMIRQYIGYCMTSTSKMDGNGFKGGSFTWQNHPFDSPSSQHYDKEFLDALDTSGIPMMTLEETEAKFGVAAPWSKDPLWFQWAGFMASQRRYDEAMPGEIKSLMDQLKSNWSGHEHRGVKFDDIFIDRRAR